MYLQSCKLFPYSVEIRCFSIAVGSVAKENEKQLRDALTAPINSSIYLHLLTQQGSIPLTPNLWKMHYRHYPPLTAGPVL